MTTAKCFHFKLNLKSFICIFSNSGILLRKCQGGWHRGGGWVREDVSPLVLLNWFTYFKSVISDLSLGDLPIYFFFPQIQFSSVTQSCPTLCDPMNCSTPGLPVHHHLPEFTQTHVHWVGDAIQPSHPLPSPFLLPPIPPSIRVFSNESTLPMRWPKYWSFSFSIIPSKEHTGLISFRMDLLDLLAVQ